MSALIDILEINNVDVVRSGHTHCREGWAQVDCPFCGDSNKKLGLYIKGKPRFNCWKCGAHGVNETVAELLGIPISKVKVLLKDMDTYSLEPSTVVKRTELILPPTTTALKRKHRDYLRSRGIDKERWELFQLKGTTYCYATPLLSWRIVIPYILKKQWVSWVARDITGESKMRYVAAKAEQEKVNRKELLFGEHLAGQSVCVVEGEFDAIAFGAGAVAVGGTGYTQHQINRLTKYPVRGICFDSEPRAQKRAKQLANLLSSFPGQTYILQLDAKDMGEASKKEIASVRRALSL
jgi:hypothetical protein